MDCRNILAHRGCWGQSVKRNSFEALKRALEEGFGIETDFRDCNGVIVISHDPPEGDEIEVRTFLSFMPSSVLNVVSHLISRRMVCRPNY